MLSAEYYVYGECDGSYILDVGNVNSKVISNTKMREMAISFHVLVDGLAYLFYLNR